LTADPSIALFRLPFQKKKKKKKTVYSFNQFTQQLKNRYSLFDMDANLQVEIKKKKKKDFHQIFPSNLFRSYLLS
jgi:hypothetical protein